MLLVGSLVLAAAQVTAAAPAPAPAPAVKTRRVCTMQEAVTGSITPKRICVTVPQQAAPVSPKPGQEADRDKPAPAPSAASGTSN
jgi:hypothetical protein